MARTKEMNREKLKATSYKPQSISCKNPVSVT